MEDLPVALGIASMAFLGMWCAERWGSHKPGWEELGGSHLYGDFEPVSMIHRVNGEKVHVLALPHREGGWQAKVWTAASASQMYVTTPELADTQARDLFRQAYPHHRCNGHCLNLAARARLRYSVTKSCMDGRAARLLRFPEIASADDAG